MFFFLEKNVQELKNLFYKKNYKNLKTFLIFSSKLVVLWLNQNLVKMFNLDSFVLKRKLLVQHRMH